MSPARAIADRFWEKVSPEPNTGCWLWMGAEPSGRSGHISFWITEAPGSGGPKEAHHVAVMLEGLDRDQHRGRCPNTPYCVNPSHFRMPAPKRGEANPGAALSDDEAALAMRFLAADRPVKEIAEHFGCSRGLVYELLHGARWSPIGRPPAVIERAEKTKKRGHHRSRARQKWWREREQQTRGQQG